MPNKTPDYSNTIFYKLCCKDVDITEIYIGHTVEFNKRQRKHRNNCNNPNNKEHNYFVYKYIRDHGGWENWDMIMIERHDCVDYLDVRRKEKEYIESFRAKLNKVVPTRTKKEYYRDHAKQITAKVRLRYQTSEELRQKKKEYTEQKKQHHQTLLEPIQQQISLNEMD